MAQRQVNAPGSGQYGQYPGSGQYGGGQYQGGYNQGPPPPPPPHPGQQYQEQDYSGGQYQPEELWDAESAPESEDQDYGRGGNKGGGSFSPANIALILGGVVGLCGACVGGFFLFGGGGGPATTTATPAWGLMAAPVVNTTTPAATSPVASVFDNQMGSLDAGADLYDGNACYDDEELLLGLCYKKCSLLTNSSFPIRSSAMSCCKEKPCGFTNQKVSVGFCSGFDVSGNHLSKGGCPHKPGACLSNEELSVGVCYKKCSILTNNTYPYRVSSVTCCKEQGAHCLLPQNMLTGLTDTSFDFQVGGGEGDGIKATPAEQHAPIASLTEAADEDSSTTLIPTV